MREIDEHGVPGTGFDFLYVDEAQDHLIMDAACTLTVLDQLLVRATKQVSL